VTARLTYAEVPEDLRHLLANGCGGEGGWKVPTWAMRLINLDEAWCDEHDVEYAIGGTEADRRKADVRLASRVFTAALDRHPITWWRGVTGAIATYRLLRRGGERYWNYDGPLTLEQLEDDGTLDLTETEWERIYTHIS
jgi:hypothetical protein